VLPLRLSFLLLLISPLLHADANPQDWIGTYALNYDGHPCTLRIFHSKKCKKGEPCTVLAASYTDEGGTTSPVFVDALDDEGRHMSFAVEVAGNRQVFHVYIFSLDKTKLAGTATSGGRTLGVFAEKIKKGSEDKSGVPNPPTAVSAVTDGQSARDKMKTSVAPGTLPPPKLPSGTPSSSIGSDGKIELRYPDGTVRRKRIGAICWDTWYPNGNYVPANCVAITTPPLTPPAPPPGSKEDDWLKAQDKAVLQVLQKILGGATGPSFQNYVQNYENPPEAVLYNRIYSRTIAISELAYGPQ